MDKTIRQSSSNTLIGLIASIMLILFLAGCSGGDEAPPVAAVTPAETALTKIATPTETSSTEIVSPLETPTEIFNSPVPTPRTGPNFEIDESVKAGDTMVRGTGPAGIAINIVDVSWGGEIKGTGIIAEDGTFAIEVTPVEGTNTIGIMLADLNGTEYTAEDFQNNENYRDIPLVGFLVDIHKVPAN